MGEETTTTTTTKESITGPKIVAFIAVLVLCQESLQTFLLGAVVIPGNIFDGLFATIAIILAIVIFISLKFIDLGPIKIPYLWWLTLIFGILFVGLAWTTTPGVGGTFGATRPYLGGVLLIIAALTDILEEKKNIVHSKFIGIAGAGIAIYECFNIIVLYVTLPAAAQALALNLIINPIIGIIAAVILIIIALDLIDIKIPYEWWVVLTIGFIIFTWVSPFFAGIGGIVIMISFILLILGH